MIRYVYRRLAHNRFSLMQEYSQTGCIRRFLDEL